MLSKIRKTGLRYTIAIVFNRIVPAWLFRCRRFLVFQIPRTIETPPRVTGFDVRWAESENETRAAETLSGFLPDGMQGTFRCAVAINESGVGAALWVGKEQFHESEIGVRIILGPEQRWLFSARVADSFRRQGVYRQLVNFVTSDADNPSDVRFLLAINPDNVRSMAAHRSFDARPVARVIAIRFLSLTTGFARGGGVLSRHWSANGWQNPIELRVSGRVEKFCDTSSDHGKRPPPPA